MYQFLRKIKNYIETNSLFKSGDTVIVGVSGGADSVALLDALHQLKDLQLRLVVAHLDHKLRGEESEEDAFFVERLSKSLDLIFEMHSVDIQSFCTENRYSLEEGGRIARYDFFRKLASKHHADAVALGHHEDDQMETILMRLVRGAGATGLTGMSPRSGGIFVRPLLSVSRKEIEDYLKQRSIPFRNDATNSDTRYLRNSIRHQLIPFLKTYNPSIRETLINTAGILSGDDELLESLTAECFSRIATTEENHAVTFRLPPLLKETKPLRFRLYRKAINEVKGNLSHITAKHLELIDRVAGSPKPNSSLTLPSQLTACRIYGRLSFRNKQMENSHKPVKVLIPGPGIFALPGGRTLKVELSTPPEIWQGLPENVAFFDLQKAPFPWSVRYFRPGDRFTPLGMTGSKKLKDFFIDMKIPRDHRYQIPLLVKQETILWVGGFRTSAEASVTSKSTDVAMAELGENSFK